MRFINTSTLQIENVSESDLVNTSKHPNGYAILSHRWGEENSEINFADVSGFYSDDQLDSVRLQRSMTKAGWPKFKGACELAKAKGFSLIWIDTCCINKRDLIDLGEAMNAHYSWYSEARVCFAYLEDVEVEGEAFTKSTWFDRGWTLQELIAPKDVQFYDKAWNFKGSKEVCCGSIQSRTGIPAEVLLHQKSPTSCSVAQRMSWAADRQTAKMEDRAYSLMGLFNINLPIIYGQREGAFMRLQEEIIKKNGDLSIFAWHMEDAEPVFEKALEICCGMLAPSPSCFAKSGHLLPAISPETFGIGQRGLSIKLKYQPYGLERYLANLLTCGPGVPGSICILLARAQNDGQFTRVRLPEGGSVAYCSIRSRDEDPTREFHVRQDKQETPLKLFPGFWLRHLDASDRYDCDMRILSHARISDNDRVSLEHGRTGIAGIIKCEPCQMPARTQRYIKWIKLGFDRDSNPACFLFHQHRSVKRDPNLLMDDDMFDKVLGSPPGMYQDERSALFDDHLLDGHWPDGHSVEKPMSYHLFKGSQESGLSVTLKSDMKLTISIKRCQDPVALVPQGIWTVDISRSHNSDHAPIQEHSKSWFRKPIFWRRKNI